MVCSLVKKGVLGTALGAGALFLVFGTSAPSYVRTAFHKVRHKAQDRIPTQFEIDRAGTRSPTSSRRSSRTAKRWPGPRWTSSISRARSPRPGPTWPSRSGSC